MNDDSVSATATATATEAIQPDYTNVLHGFLDQVLREPWGTPSRARLDYLIFCALVASGRVDLADSEFEISNMLQTTPGRVSTLLYRFEQDAVRSDKALLSGLLTPQNITFAAKLDGDNVRVQVRSKYLREYFISRLISSGAITTREVTPTTFTTPIDDFMRVLIELGFEGPSAESPEGQAFYGKLFTRLVEARNKGGLEEFFTGYGSRTKDAVTVVNGFANLFTKLHEAWGAFTS